MPSIKKRKAKHNETKEGSNEEVLMFETAALLRSAADSASTGTADTFDNSRPDPDIPDPFTEIELQIAELSSTGDGLALSPSSDRVYVVPFAVPGDAVTARIIRHFPTSYSMTDFVKLNKPSKQRDDSLVKCQYFSRCSGCQLQMLSYEDQLAHKKNIIKRAYLNFSGIDPSTLPSIGHTIGSPLQYGYRTKLTPHFDGPIGSTKRKKKAFEEVPPIGFMLKGRRKVLDIEECPIGTDAVRKGMKSERKRITETFQNFKNGATLLLRESTGRIPVGEPGFAVTVAPQTTKQEFLHQNGSPANDEQFLEDKTCVTDHNGVSVEYIDDFVFRTRAGSFFQNNNSILSTFTSYIRSHALDPADRDGTPAIKYLLDAYCGSGLFTITLSSIFSSSLGIDTDPRGISTAQENAQLNKLPNANFMHGDASTLFADVTFPPDETLLVIDPPRKGCGDDFLRQLLRYGPKRVVYVSCNVHSQARDVGFLVVGSENWYYEVESLQGFDFFPQTGHVEVVAILNRRDAEKDKPVQSWEESEVVSFKSLEAEVI